MKRREFITLLGGAVVTWPFAARAQQGNGIRLIGVLMGIRTIQRGGHKSTPFGRGFRSSGGLRDSKYQDRVSMGRWGPQPYAVLRNRDCSIKARPDCGADRYCTRASSANATSKIPIVFVSVSDPISNGFRHKPR